MFSKDPEVESKLRRAFIRSCALFAVILPIALVVALTWGYLPALSYKMVYVGKGSLIGYPPYVVMQYFFVKKNGRTFGFAPRVIWRERDKLDENANIVYVLVVLLITTLVSVLRPAWFS